MVTPDPGHWAPLIVLFVFSPTLQQSWVQWSTQENLQTCRGCFLEHSLAQNCSGLYLTVTVVLLASWGLLSASATCALQSHNLHSLPALTLVTNKPRSCGFTPPFLWLYNLLFTVRSFSGGDPGVPWHWIEGEIEGCLSRLYSSWVHK